MQSLERDRAELIEALNYWLPDETLVNWKSEVEAQKFHEHVELLVRLQGEDKERG